MRKRRKKDQHIAKNNYDQLRNIEQEKRKVHEKEENYH